LKKFWRKFKNLEFFGLKFKFFGANLKISNFGWKFEIFGEIEFGGFLKFQFNNWAAFLNFNLIIFFNKLFEIIIFKLKLFLINFTAYI
jgi:hypothetical protein